MSSTTTRRGTPCEAVLAGETCLYQDGVQALFPKDEALVEMAAQGNIAVPLSDQSGGVLVHLALIDVKPMPMAPRDLSVFTIFAARAHVRSWRASGRRRHGRVARSGCRARDKTAQRWSPEGLTALRASREEFPIEATLSPFEAPGKALGETQRCDLSLN